MLVDDLIEMLEQHRGKKVISRDDFGEAYENNVKITQTEWMQDNTILIEGGGEGFSKCTTCKYNTEAPDAPIEICEECGIKDEEDNAQYSNHERIKL